MSESEENEYHASIEDEINELIYSEDHLNNVCGLYISIFKKLDFDLDNNMNPSYELLGCTGSGEMLENQNIN